MADPTTQDRDQSIFGLLSRIYANGLLTNSLKHYYACRVFCLAYNASSVSILLYDGGMERLISKGIYLHRNAIKPLLEKDCGLDKRSFLVTDEEMLHVVRYIGFYHYLLSVYASSSLPNHVDDERAYKLSEYFKSKRYLSYDLPKQVDIIENGSRKKKDTTIKADAIDFIQFCLANSRKHATNEAGILERSTSKYYSLIHKELISKEVYKIGTNVDSFSGRLYQKLSIPGAIDNDYEILLSTESELQNETQPRTLIQNLRNIGVKFRHKQYYVGVPLISSGRCIGILRMLYPIGESVRVPKTGHLFYAPRVGTSDALKSFLSDSSRKQDLLYSIEILGNLLEQSYPQSFMQSIPKDLDFVKLPGETDLNNPFNNWCTAVQKAINCHGCMLRFKDSSLTVPARMGHSASINEFVNSLKQAGDKQFIIKDGKFHPALTSIFPNVNVEVVKGKLTRVSSLNVDASRKHSKKIVAALIDFGNEYSVKETKVLRYYYVQDNSEFVKSTSNISEFGGKFQPLILIDKKKPEESLITSDYHRHFIGNLFSDTAILDRINHKARFLLIIDIPSIELAGVVTFSNTANRRFLLNDVRFAYTQVARLGASISNMYSTSMSLAISNSMHRLRGLRDVLSEVLLQLRESQETESAISKLRFVAEKLDKRIRSLTEYDIGATYINDLATTEDHAYDLAGYLSEKIISEFEDEAHEKEIKLDVVNYLKSPAMTNINKECLWWSIEGILENAFRYSSSGGAMENPKSVCYVEGFKKNTPLVPGNVSVCFSELQDFIRIDVKNYGQKIDDKTFTNELDLVNVRSRKGHGIGLYIVRSFLARIGSELLPPQSHNCGAIFSIKIKYR